MTDHLTPTTDAERAREDPIDAFVGYAYSLARRDDGAARAALAELRRSATDSVQHVRALSILGDRIPDGVRGWQLNAYVLTAQLLAIYAAGGEAMPDRRLLPRRRNTLGASARYVNPRKLNTNGDYEDSQPGIGTRFSALLALPAEDLPEELRRFIRLLRSKDAPVDFYRLLHDLLRWEHPEQIVQTTWARHYWASAQAEASPDPSNA